jgi:Cof subfamily protein (haloacid dehalogenase superfamily)
LIKLLGTDLDGTLLRSDGTVSARTREALQRARENDLLVAFVTGRPPRWLHEVAEATGHIGVAVAANGAVLYDLATESVITEHVLSVELLDHVTAQLREAFPRIVFGVEYGATFGSEPGYVHEWDISPARDRRGNVLPPPIVAELAEIISQPGVKLLAKDRDADPDAFLELATTLVGEHVSLTHSSSIGLLEIGAAGITKASGLAYLAERNGVSQAEVAAVGDMPNDIPMLEWAGQPYAVANAHPSVLALVPNRLGSNDEDAVAGLIDALLDAPNS